MSLRSGDGICAAFAEMTMLSSPACILSAVPHASRPRTPGSRKYTQRRGAFTLTVRGSHAESGGFESPGNGQVLPQSDHMHPNYIVSALELTGMRCKHTVLCCTSRMGLRQHMTAGTSEQWLGQHTS